MNQAFKTCRKLFLLLSVALFVSCNPENEPEDTPEEVVVEDLLEFSLDGVFYRTVNNAVGLTSLTTDYSGNVDYTVYIGNAAQKVYTFEYGFTSGGALQFFKLNEREYLPNGQMIVEEFKTPAYKPLHSFQIIKFIHFQNTNKVQIEFTGTLTSTTHPEVTKQITGKIITDVMVMPNYGRDYCYIKQNSGTLDLQSMYYNKWSRGGGTDFEYNYFTGNGYNVTIHLNQKLSSFQNITFDETSTINNVIFRKAVAPYQLNGSMQIDEYDNDLQQWQQYNTSGNIVITDVYYGSNPGTALHVKGVIYLTIKDSNNNIIDVQQLEFVTVD